MAVLAVRSFTFDAKKTVRGKFKPSNAAERKFAKALKMVARASGHIIDRHIDVDGVGLGVIINEPGMTKALNDYAKTLTPWAKRQSAKLLEQVRNSNTRAYQNKSKAIGKAIKLEAYDSHVGIIARALMDEQVELIRSIPIEAGRRAQKIAFEAALAGTRAAPDKDTVAELQKQLGMSTEVAETRALLIARTETARSNAAINQARAMSVGSNQYRWHNSGDSAVRDSHKRYKGKRLQGMIFSWDHPPTLDDGMTGHPGTFPNCRCFAEPVFDTE